MDLHLEFRGETQEVGISVTGVLALERQGLVNPSATIEK